MIGDLCETQTAECGVSRKRVIGVGLLLWLVARGENRLFSPEEVRPICFCGTSPCSCPLSPFRVLSPAYGGRKSNIVVRGQLPAQVFRRRRKTTYKAKRNRVWPPALRRCKQPLYQFSGITKNSSSFFILDSERFAARAPRITTSVKQERLKRTVFPKGVNGSQGPCPPVPCGSEGKPDFPL